MFRSGRGRDYPLSGESRVGDWLRLDLVIREYIVRYNKEVHTSDIKLERQPLGRDETWTRLLTMSLILEPSLDVDLHQAEAMKGCRPSICPCASRPSAAPEPLLPGTQQFNPNFIRIRFFWMYEYTYVRYVRQVRVSYGRLCHTFDIQSRKPDIFLGLDVHTNKPLLHSRAHQKER